MKRKIVEIEGIGPIDKLKLEQAHINTVDELLRRGSSKTGRKQISENSGIDIKTISDWVSIADLLRLDNLDFQLAYLIKRVGIDTIKELCKHNPEDIYTNLINIKETNEIMDISFSLSDIKELIKQANKLKPTIYY